MARRKKRGGAPTRDCFLAFFMIQAAEGSFGMLCRKSRVQMRKRSWHGRQQALSDPVFGKLKSILFRNRFI